MSGSVSVPRRTTLAALAQAPLDLLVIGGGIVGAGVAREAALRGLHVGLAEQHDFAFGTSSRSSRLLHGGLRYLAQGRLGLVRQASAEKLILHRIAPHLAQPISFLFPAYKGTQWPRWQLKLGVKLYDWLCQGKNFGKSETLTPPQVLACVSQLNPDGLTGAVRYFDAFTNDARLVIDTLRSAAKEGAVVSNYLGFRNATSSSGLWNCELEDRLAGQKLSVQSRAIINATGPWAQQVPHSGVRLHLTKGIHLVLPRERLPVPEAIAITQGARLLFVLPWGERVIIGTTDTDYQGSPEDVRASREDIAYLLEALAQFFPGSAITESDVISIWAGLRPLLATSTARPSDISRAHQLSSPEPGWWDLAGGKLTTYRLMAQEAVEAVLNWFSRAGGLEPPALENARAAHGRSAEESLLPPTATAGVSAILPPLMQRETTQHYCLNEWALHLDDVMLRRTGWHYYFSDARERAEQVSHWMSETLGWTAETRAAELTRYLTLFR